MKGVSTLHCIYTLYVLAFLVRICFVIYGEWQDNNFSVRYTDVDYDVFTDAARYVYNGESPYNRPTYRYTPLLAWLLVPNISLHIAWGKVLFSMADVFVGWLIQHTLLFLLQHHKHDKEMWKKLLNGETDKEWWAMKYACLWLFNPMSIGICSRGNAESLVCLLVLSTLHLLVRRKLMASVVLYALSIHFKVYPIVFAPALLLFVNSNFINDITVTRHDVVSWKQVFLIRVQCILVGVLVFCGLTAFTYSWYGQEFLDEAYLYHVTRRDNRHNFSLYFYLIYLTYEQGTAFIAGLLAFLPQILLLLSIAWAYAEDIVYCCFLLTFVFVMFNKVCTSQYFLWYLCMLPIIAPFSMLSIRRSVVMGLVWGGVQAIWLYFAYQLEFLGHDTFTVLWLACILFFLANALLFLSLVTHHRFMPVFQRRQSAMKLDKTN